VPRLLRWARFGSLIRGKPRFYCDQARSLGLKVSPRAAQATVRLAG
jgi:hypothetical protein